MKSSLRKMATLVFLQITFKNLLKGKIMGPFKNYYHVNLEREQLNDKFLGIISFWDFSRLSIAADHYVLNHNNFNG